MNLPKEFVLNYEDATYSLKQERDDVYIYQRKDDHYVGHIDKNWVIDKINTGKCSIVSLRFSKHRERLIGSSK